MSEEVNEKTLLAREELAGHYKSIINLLGEDVDREGLFKTPERVAKAMQFLTKGYHEDPAAVLRGAMFKEEDYKQMVIVKDIDIFSYCEHHMALMYDMKVTVAYVPNGKVIGLSKIARIADMVSKRLQLQERIGTDIAEIMQEITGSDDVAVLIEGCHSCMTARGIKKTAAKTYTTTLRGRFQTDLQLQMRLNR